MEKSIKSRLRVILLPILYVALITAISVLAEVLFEANYYSNYYVSGSSMSPTLSGDLNDADYGIYDKSKTAIKNVKRYQLLLTYYPNDQESVKIKRLLFKPGDTFEVVSTYNIENNCYESQMWLFDSPTSSNHRILDFPFDTSNIKNDHYYPKTTLKENQYFLAGDNWDNSTDSFDEDVGPIDFDLLVGVVCKAEGRCKVVDGKITEKRPYKQILFNGVNY